MDQFPIGQGPRQVDSQGRFTRQLGAGESIFPECGTIVLAVVFGKNERDDRSPTDRRAIEAIVRAYRAELEADFRRRQPRHPGQEQGKIDG